MPIKGPDMLVISFLFNDLSLPCLQDFATTTMINVDDESDL